MTEDMERTDVIKHLSGLNEVDLIGLFYEAISEKNVHEIYEAGWNNEVLVIGRSVSTSGDPLAYTQIFALPEGGVLNIDKSEKNRGVCESGQCPLCKTSLACIGKEAICPICKTNVECT